MTLVNPGVSGRVVTAGNMVVDVVVRNAEAFPPPGHIEWVDAIDVQPGGNGVNTAIALGILGGKALAVGRVGQDGFGDLLIQAMESVGVDAAGVGRDPEAGTAVTVAGVRTDGERSFLHAKGANARFTPADIPWERVAGAKVFHLSSVFALPGMDGPPGADVLARAQEMGMVTMLDVCWDPEGRWWDLLRGYLPHVDFFLPNCDEARALTGEADPAIAAKVFTDAGCGCVVVKLGPEGCYVHSRDVQVHLEGFAVEGVDTTGAGDAFGAGFIVGWLAGMDPVAAARAGNAVGALAVSAPGTNRLVSFAETLAMFGL